jgi:NTE family protein
MLKKLFNNKGFDESITFGELYQKTNKKLYLTGTCLNDNTVHYFSADTHSTMSIIMAIRITMLVPFYYTPISYNNNMYVDGGCIDNYPINLFRNELYNVLGIYIQNLPLKNDTPIETFEDYLGNIIKSLIQGYSHEINNNYKKYTINIKTENINVMDLEMDEEQKEKIFNIGYNFVKNLLQ